MKAKNNNIVEPLLVLASIGALIAGIWYLLADRTPNGSTNTDVTKLNNDWQNLYGDYAKSTNKFLAQHGSI
jgi:hypothetical protein